MTNVAILGWGCAVPEHCVSQLQAAECLLAAAPPVIRQHEERWRRIFEHSRIRKRHTVVTRETLRQWQQSNLSGAENPLLVRGSTEARDVIPDATDAAQNGRAGPTTALRMRSYHEYAAELAEPATRQALTESGCPPEAVTHLITASCTGFSAPGVDVQLVQRLGLPAEVARLHVGYMGCHAAINALRAAQGFLAHCPTGRVLLCCVELCSLHWQYTAEAEKWLGNVLFADGAAALVLANTGPPDTWKLTATGSTLLANTYELMSWTIGDHGFEMYVSPQLPVVLPRCLRDWLGDWLRRHGWSVDRIRSWAIHPGGPKILEAVTAALELSPAALEASWHILSEYGNMSSPSVLFVLEHLRRHNAPRPALALAFGPGLTLEVALFE
jgi:predicted naringenin-chalcone synthase